LLFPPPFLILLMSNKGGKTGCLLQLAFTTKVNHVTMVTTLQVKQLICLSQTSGQMPLMGQELVATRQACCRNQELAIQESFFLHATEV